MSDEGAPKSAYELAMARLRQKDKQEGREDKPLSDEQRAKLAEIRSFYEAKLAEREILHQSALARAGGEPEALEKLEGEYRRDRDRLSGERDRKLEELRNG
jgi:hypothetical protein